MYTKPVPWLKASVASSKSVDSVTTVLLAEILDKQLHMHGNTAKEIKRNNAPNSRDDNPTYATLSSVSTSASSQLERANIGHGNETSS